MASSRQTVYRKELWIQLYIFKARYRLSWPANSTLCALEEFVQTLGAFFELVASANFKLNMVKSSLFEREILWCGRLISSEGVRPDPARVSALIELPLPESVADLQYFVCATNWLHDSLPDYTRVVVPLQDKLNTERVQIGRRNPQ
ncbi:hypothetical protein PHMEG_00024882 [Phytophthora megakarya]|uniref:Reverse transcriptase n=1 Tax=Phytophthora megakarya TaxID=4795 RepID=A0A225VF28_9STRA|nr:hypothetical protein PHMEG_00024882 [Phytophthora megakarya]